MLAYFYLYDKAARKNMIFLLTFILGLLLIRDTRDPLTGLEVGETPPAMFYFVIL